MRRFGEVSYSIVLLKQRVVVMLTTVTQTKYEGYDGPTSDLNENLRLEVANTGGQYKESEPGLQKNDRAWRKLGLRLGPEGLYVL